MVYFANKTRNHAKGFRIQKHLLPANESCVLVLQNCCATDFRKTVIRFVARQVPRRIPPRKFGVPGRLAPFQSLSRRFPLRSMPTRRIHRKTSRRSSQNREGVRQTSAYNKHSSHRSPHYSKKQLVRRLEQSIAKRTTIDASPEGLPIGRPRTAFRPCPKRARGVLPTRAPLFPTTDRKLPGLPPR